MPFLSSFAPVSFTASSSSRHMLGEFLGFHGYCKGMNFPMPRSDNLRSGLLMYRVFSSLSKLLSPQNLFALSSSHSAISVALPSHSFKGLAAKVSYVCLQKVKLCQFHIDYYSHKVVKLIKRQFSLLVIFHAPMVIPCMFQNIHKCVCARQGLFSGYHSQGQRKSC